MFLGDSPAVDSFGRLRVSMPTYVFDGQLTYDLAPLIYEQSTTGSGATITHDATNRCASLDFSSSPLGSIAKFQTFEHFRYQAGRSQQIFITFNFNGGVASVSKDVGYWNGANGGIFLRMNGTTPQFRIFSTTSQGDNLASQSSWNLDKFDGTGASGKTLDFTKVQILVIDFQALYVGRVRLGFDIDGVVYPAHEFKHANLVTYPYIASANLPICARMFSSSVSPVTTSMDFICCSVISEGGSTSDLPAYHLTANGTVTAANGAATHILSVRPKTTFNSITNRSKFVLHSINLLAGTNPVFWQLCAGQAISGTTTFNDVNTAYSAFEYNTAGTVSGSPAIVLASGFLGSSAVNNASLDQNVSSRMPITLDAAGAVRALGTLTLLVTGVGGTSACQASFNWEEIR